MLATRNGATPWIWDSSSWKHLALWVSEYNFPGSRPSQWNADGPILNLGEHQHRWPTAHAGATCPLLQAQWPGLLADVNWHGDSESRDTIFVMLVCSFYYVHFILGPFGALSWRGAMLYLRSFLHLLRLSCDLYVLYETYWFEYVEPSLHLWNENNLIMVILMWYWIWCANTLLRMFASMFIWKIDQ